MRESNFVVRILRRAPIALVLAALPLGFGQSGPVPPGGPPAAPVPGAIAAARKAFVSNAGIDGYSLPTFRRAGDVNQPYNWFYDAMKKWGRYDLTGAPADADLIFEIRFAAPLTDCGRMTEYQPQLQLRILDPRTRIVLWYLAEPVYSALRRTTWDKNFNEGLANLMVALKYLAGPAPAAGSQ